MQFNPHMMNKAKPKTYTTSLVLFTLFLLIMILVSYIYFKPVLFVKTWKTWQSKLAHIIMPDKKLTPISKEKMLAQTKPHHEIQFEFYSALPETPPMQSLDFSGDETPSTRKNAVITPHDIEQALSLEAHLK